MEKGPFIEKKALFDRIKTHPLFKFSFVSVMFLITILFIIVYWYSPIAIAFYTMEYKWVFLYLIHLVIYLKVEYWSYIKC